MQPAENFEGHTPRECGEHRTVGSHRAWCFECSEWCYPRIEAACKGCELAWLRALLAKGEAARDADHIATCPLPACAAVRASRAREGR